MPVSLAQVSDWKVSSGVVLILEAINELKPGYFYTVPELKDKLKMAQSSIRKFARDPHMTPYCTEVKRRDGCYILLLGKPEDVKRLKGTQCQSASKTK